MEKVRYSYAIAKARELLKVNKCKKPPVDVSGIIQRHGISLSYHLIPDLNYAVTFKKGEVYSICINVTSPERDRWSMAHELGHVWLGHYDLDVDTLAECKTTEKERYTMDREADIFTRELLMPEDWVKQAAVGPFHKGLIVQLKNNFDVSWKAIIYRLDELKIISKEQSEKMLSSPTTHG